MMMHMYMRKVHRKRALASAWSGASVQAGCPHASCHRLTHPASRGLDSDAAMDTGTSAGCDLLLKEL